MTKRHSSSIIASALMPVMTLGTNIREARKRKGLTQVDLGRLCGWEDAQTRISKYENDEREPSYEDLRAIGRATGTPMPLFFVDEDDKSEIGRFIQSLLRLSPARRSGLIRFLEETLQEDQD